MTDHGEDTNVVVNRMLSKRRNMRVPVIIGSILGVGFLTYMGLEFGARRTPPVDGPPSPVNPINPTGADDAPPVAKGAPEAAPVGKPGRVEIVVEGKNPQLWVDDKQVAVTPKLSLQLPVGKHILLVKASGRTLTQRLAIDPGVSYHVDFRDKGDPVVTTQP